MPPLLSNSIRIKNKTSYTNLQAPKILQNTIFSLTWSPPLPVAHTSPAHSFVWTAFLPDMSRNGILPSSGLCSDITFTARPILINNVSLQSLLAPALPIPLFLHSNFNYLTYIYCTCSSFLLEYKLHEDREFLVPFCKDSTGTYEVLNKYLLNE